MHATSYWFCFFRLPLHVTDLLELSDGANEGPARLELALWKQIKRIKINIYVKYSNVEFYLGIR